MRYLRHDLGLDDPPSTTTKKEPRKVGLLATLLALSLGLTWPPVAGLALGVAGALWAGEWWPIRVGLAFGVALGALISMGILAGSYIVTHVIMPAQMPAPVPNSFTVGFTPLTEGEQHVRVVPVYDKGRTYIDDVPLIDLVWFATGLSLGMKHTQSAWLGTRAPSGQLVDAAYWGAICRPFRRVGVIDGVGPRRAGRLVTTDIDTMLLSLGIDPYDVDNFQWPRASEPWRDVKRLRAPGEAA